MNFYKRHIGDYIKKAGHLTLLEHGIYARLMDVYYTREAGIPEDKAGRLIGARSKEELQALANVLDEFFTLVDGTWTQGRCEEEIAIASEKADKNRLNGAKGGRPKKAATNSQPTENPDGSTFGNHVGSKNNLSQTPDSRHQTKTYADDDSTDSSRASSLPAEFDDPGFSHPGAAPLPPREDPPVSADPAIILTVALRKLGVDATFTHPTVRDWADRKITMEVLTAAVGLAREQKGPTAKIPPNYLMPIVEKLLNPPAPSASGRPIQQPQPIAIRRPQGTDPKGPDESYEDWLARVDAAERAMRKGSNP